MLTAYNTDMRPNPTIISDGQSVILSLTSEMHSVEEFIKDSEIEKHFSSSKIIFPHPHFKNWMPFGKVSEYEIDYLNSLIGEYCPNYIFGMSSGANILAYLNIPKSVCTVQHSPFEKCLIDKVSNLIILGGKNPFVKTLKPKIATYIFFPELGFSWGIETNERIKQHWSYKNSYNFDQNVQSFEGKL